MIIMTSKKIFKYWISYQLAPGIMCKLCEGQIDSDEAFYEDVKNFFMSQKIFSYEIIEETYVKIENREVKL